MIRKRFRSSSEKRRRTALLLTPHRPEGSQLIFSHPRATHDPGRYDAVSCLAFNIHGRRGDTSVHGTLERHNRIQVGAMRSHRCEAVVCGRRRPRLGQLALGSPKIEKQAIAHDARHRHGEPDRNLDVVDLKIAKLILARRR